MQHALRHPLAVLSCGALLAALLWTAFRALPGRAARPTPAGAGHPARAELRWNTGDGALYDLSVETEVQPSSSLDAAPLAQSLRGLLDFLVVDASGESVELALCLHAARLEIGGQGDPGIDARLARPFRATFSREGRLIGCQPPVECSPREGELLIELVAELQWLVPPTADRTWEREEEHASGRYLARYVRDAQGRMTKTKQRYLAAAADPGRDVLASRWEARLAGTGSWLESLGGEERLVVRTRIDTLRSRTALRLSRLPEATRKALTERLARAVRLPVESAPSRAVPVTLALSSEIEARLHELLSAIDTLERPQAGDHVALRDLLASCPALALRVPELLRTSGWQERARCAVLHALEIVASPAAQSALAATLVDPEQAGADRLRAVLAAAGLSAAGPSVVLSLRTLAAEERGGPTADLAAAAQLALGCIARGLDAREPDRAAEVCAELSRRLGHAAEREAVVLLAALGNSGAGESVPWIAAFLDAPSAGIRSAAAAALGQIDVEASLEPLRLLLEREHAPEVRATAARALGRLTFTTPACTRTVEEQLGKERDEPVRLALTRYLADRLDDHPELRPVLERVAETPGSKRTRRAAGDALAAAHARSR